MAKIENPIISDAPSLGCATSMRRRFSPIGIPPSILDEALWEIVEQSAFLEERLGADFLTETRGGDPESVEQRMAAWQKNCARGDAKVFQKRLEWDGLDVGYARSLAGRARRANPDLPFWAWLLGSMILSSQKPGDETLQKNDLASIRVEQPVAFEEFLHPFLRLARKALQEVSGTAYFLVAETAHRRWERSLLLSLEEIAEETLGLEFTKFHTAHQASAFTSTSGYEALPGVNSRTVYESFLRTLQGEGLLRLFLEYPVMARFLATRLSFWVDAASEFLHRLEADRAELTARFNQGEPLGQLTKLGVSLSDPHRGGRTALRAHFASGVRLIYKPKAIKSEVAYWNLLDWINRNAGLPHLRTLPVVDRGAYGWVEEIAPGPCRNPGEVEAFYQRAGMLLCLVYVLEGNDAHNENVIAAGEHPVLIDHETLFLPHARSLRAPGEEGAMFLASRSFYEDSVMRTGMLPHWEIRPSGESYDLSGLGGTQVQLTHRHRKVWENINTDSMRLRPEAVSIQLADNVVSLNGEAVEPAAHADQMAAGFDEMYRFLWSREAELLAPDSPLRNWGKLRFVFRGTAVYASMRKRLYSPRFLRHGMDASIELERLSRPLLYSAERPVTWPILADERRSLLQGDIPMFSSLAEDESLFLEGGGSIPQFFQYSGFSQLQKRFESLGEEDLQRQLGFLHATFETKRGEPKMSSNIAAEVSEVAGKVVAGPEEFLAEALRIAHQVRAAARPFGDGVSWNTAAYYPDVDRWRWEPMGPRFYDGLGGTAVFLAATYKTVHEPEFAALARSALATIVHESLRPDAATSLFEMGIGAGVGPASIIYPLVRAGDFLGEEEWLQPARRLAELLDAEHITADRRFDLMAGAAGAALALLALYDATRLPEILAKAVLCGEHLLQHRSESPQGLRAWKNCGEEMLTGFSHGAAGIAYALLKLYQATGRNSFREAAVEAEAYETSLFNPQVSNWPDLRRPRTEQGYVYSTAWCHGAPGIVLSRLAALPILDTPQVRQDISRGLEATRRMGVEDQDHLCCGSMGRVEALLVAAQKLGDPACSEDARQIASTILRRSQPPGNYALGWKKVPFLASFHQGMSGIGYQYLRLAAPGSLPSLLLWE